MDNGHGGGKYGKWEVSLRVPDPMEPGLLEQPVREEGGADGLPAALWGAESGAGWRPGTGGRRCHYTGRHPPTRCRGFFLSN